jgi:phosphoribosylformimino-5-aminoimidazole carboxamide ribotide isomerase
MTEAMSTFDLLPAIDLRGGRVVRLREGDFDREDVFAQDGAAVARRFAESGARWLHVVDLDGARAGEPVQGAQVAAIIEAVGRSVSCEVAGGLRSADAAAAALDSGAARVVLGTAALRDPGLVRGVVDRHGPDRVAIAIDVRDGQAVGEAWAAGASGRPALDAIQRLADAGAAAFEVTAIDRDGLMGGPDLDLLGRLVALDPGAVIASGGIRSIEDLRAVRDLGCAGAIVGRAIYEGTLDLSSALAALSGDATA